MRFSELRNELYDFYLHGDAERSRAFAEHCFKILNSRFRDGMSVTEQKLLQYEVICSEFTPVLFADCPYYFETGALTSLSDGARIAKGYGHYQAAGWVYKRNVHLFWEQSEDLNERRKAHSCEQLYLICGPYNDDCQHFNFNNRPILEGGLRGIYEQAQQKLASASTSEQAEFYRGVMGGMLALKKVAEKFALKAEELFKTQPTESLSLIAKTAKRVPWEKPQTLYEALATLAFMRKALGTIEGVGPNTFGRVDLDLYPFYQADIESGRLTREEAKNLIAQFLIVWDTHYDHDMKMVGYSDHELENTYTLGGCDKDGNPVFNELTELFLEVTEEEKIIFPKIKCRFASNSPKGYLDAVNRALVSGTSTLLYQNDEATIASLVRNGRSLEEARDYVVTGCWGVATYQEKYDHGNYLNILKPFELAIHGLIERIQKTRIDFSIVTGEEKDFETLYALVVEYMIIPSPTLNKFPKRQNVRVCYDQQKRFWENKF